jgi:hypothetical protein
LVEGEKQKATVESDVLVNNVLVFKKGAKATLYVTDVKKAGLIGIPGKILISNGKVFDVNGNEHNIEYLNKIEGVEKTYPKVLVGISIFLLFPLALFTFVKGGEAKTSQQIPINTILNENFDFRPTL